MLFDADPSSSEVEIYLRRGVCYLAKQNSKIVAEFVLMETRSGVFEIMNIAVAKKVQSKGIGTKLIRKAKSLARANGAHTFEVRTGNSSFRQLIFYQRS